MSRWMQGRAFVAAIACAFLLPACVRSYDATIANPCGTELSIETYAVPASDLSEDERLAEFRLPPQEITKVEGVFHDASGMDWTLVVVDTEFEIEVSKDQVVDETILIPAAACPQS